MRSPWRPLALAVVLHVTAALGVSMAQTVIVTKAPQGSTVELSLNTETLGSTIVDASGIATLDVNLAVHGGKNETDVHFYLDACNNLRGVRIVEAGSQAPPLRAGCTRNAASELYLMRRVTTFVVDVSQPGSMVWLTQGSAPKAWLNPELERADGGKSWGPLPTGLVLSGGGGHATFRDAVGVACGNVAGCTGNGVKFVPTAGVSFWFTPFLAAEASYLNPGDVTAAGSGDRYRFNSTLETRLVTVAAKLGAPAGPVRLYGQAGATYHRVTSTTVQTMDDHTVTVDDVTTVITGGTQSFGIATSGWGWSLGGGMEAWMKPTFAIYGEAGYAPLNGADTGGGEGRIDDRVVYFAAGARVRLWR